MENIEENSESSGRIINADTLNDTLTDAEEIVLPKRSRGKPREYKLFKFFPTVDEAEELIKTSFQENQWIKKNKSETSAGITDWYGCKHKGCKALVQLRTSEIGCTLLYSTDEHLHTDRTLVKIGIDTRSKEKIEELEALNLRPAEILIQLRDNGFKLPTLMQLNNYLKELRKSKAGNSNTSICLQDLVDFYENNKEIPLNPDKVFVADCWTKVALENGEQIRMFRLFITTKRLLSFAGLNDHILADATYKLVLEGYPCITVGTTDKQKSFHPFGLAICFNEKDEDFKFVFESISKTKQRIDASIIYAPKKLIADCAPAIHNGFESAYGNSFFMSIILFCLNCLFSLTNRKARKKNQLLGPCYPQY